MSTPLNRRVDKYIDDVFSGVGPSQELADLKEELATNLREKIADLRARGLDDNEAFREAVISLGDLSGLVDDMRRIGQQQARDAAYVSMSARISIAGIVLGVLLILFGIFTMLMLYTMGGHPGQVVAGNAIFVVIGGAILTYGALTRETRRKYPMHPIRAGLYALAIGLVLFGLFAGTTARFSTGQVFVGIAATMIFFLAGVGLLLVLVLTGRSRIKDYGR